MAERTSKFKFVTKVEVTTYRVPTKDAPDLFDQTVVSRSTLAILPESNTERAAEKEKAVFLIAFSHIKNMFTK